MTNDEIKFGTLTSASLGGMSHPLFPLCPVLCATGYDTSTLLSFYAGKKQFMLMEEYHTAA